MLNMTRTWNAVCAAATLRRGLALARDFARRRVAFGAPLAEKPLHLETLADLAAEHEASFLLTFFAVELLGARRPASSTRRRRAAAAGAAVAKLRPGRQTVAGASRCSKASAARATSRTPACRSCSATARCCRSGRARRTCCRSRRTARCCAATRCAWRSRGPPPRVVGAARVAARAVRASRCGSADHLESWWADAAGRGAWLHEAAARRFATTVGRTLALALLVEHADWAIEHERDARSSGRRGAFARLGVDALADVAPPPLRPTRLALGEVLEPGPESDRRRLPVPRRDGRTDGRPPGARRARRRGLEPRPRRRRSASSPSTAARRPTSPADAARGAAVVFACTGDDAALRAITLGARSRVASRRRAARFISRRFAGMERGSTFVDHTTVSMTVTRELAADRVRRGCRLRRCAGVGRRGRREEGTAHRDGGRRRRRRSNASRRFSPATPRRRCASVLPVPGSSPRW
jgi:hypothetical protein